jgi:hypothetical protein
MTLLSESDHPFPCPGCGTPIYANPLDPRPSLAGDGELCQGCGKYRLRVVTSTDDDSFEPYASAGFGTPGTGPDPGGGWRPPELEWVPIATEPPSEPSPTVE